MKLDVSQTKQELGTKAARHGADAIRKAIRANGRANVIVATGASQFEMIENLVQTADIAWNKVTAFHLDEYVGLPITHGASFCKYFWERFVRKLPLPLNAFHYVQGDAADPKGECKRLGRVIGEHPIDVAFVGIGENAHLAFNDPPADFKTEEAYRIVNLDTDCRKQQMGEGWFKTIDDVPKQAISMSCRQIMKAGTIICSVPDQRKANAVKGAVEGPVTPDCPSSILQQHADATIYLDKESASLLKK
ncbi:MAG: glucosamine-6-phosphate deaminase [Tepidisphaeraceae bacterium]